MEANSWQGTDSDWWDLIWKWRMVLFYFFNFSWKAIGKLLIFRFSLFQAKANFEKEERRKELKRLRGEDTWMLPDVNERIEQFSQVNTNRFTWCNRSSFFVFIQVNIGIATLLVFSKVTEWLSHSGITDWFYLSDRNNIYIFSEIIFFNILDIVTLDRFCYLSWLVD